MIVSRFTSYTKNFVICCYQVTKFSCSRYGCASAFSARSSRNLGSLANIAIFSPSTREYKNCACPSPTPLSLATLKLTHEKNSRVCLCELEHVHPPDFPQFLATILADQATGFYVRSCCLHFYFYFLISAGSCDGLTHTVLLVLSLHFLFMREALLLAILMLEM